MFGAPPPAENTFGSAPNQQDFQNYNLLQSTNAPPTNDISPPQLSPAADVFAKGPAGADMFGAPPPAENTFGSAPSQQDFQNYNPPAVDVNAPPTNDISPPQRLQQQTCLRKVLEEATCLAPRLQPTMVLGAADIVGKMLSSGNPQRCGRGRIRPPTNAVGATAARESPAASRAPPTLWARRQLGDPASSRQWARLSSGTRSKMRATIMRPAVDVVGATQRMTASRAPPTL